MNTVTRKPSATFVKESKLISKPGAVITVHELTLTDFGIRAITSGSSGIRQGHEKTPARHHRRKNGPRVK